MPTIYNDWQACLLSNYMFQSMIFFINHKALFGFAMMMMMPMMTMMMMIMMIMMMKMMMMMIIVVVCTINIST